jgi:hypothetical protein
MAIKHTKVATAVDDGTSEVGTNEWNDNHTIDNNTITDDMVASHTTTKITVPTTKLSGTVTNAQLAGSIANTKLATDPLARANHTGSQAASTISDFDTEVSNNSAVAANTAKVTNATHTGDVTGSTSLTIASGAVDNDMLSGSIANSKLATDPLARANHTGSQAISSVSGLQSALDGKIDDSQVLTNVPSGAVFTDTNTTYSVGDGGLTQKNFTSTLKSKLDGIATSANNYSHPNHTGDVTGSSSLTIASGAVDLAHMSASGTKNSSTYLRGDNTWASISAGGDIQEAFSGVSSGSITYMELTGLPSKEWYHVIGVMKGNQISNGAGLRAYAGGTLFTGYSTTVHETRGYYTDYNNDSYARFVRNAAGGAVGLDIWLMIRNGQLYYNGSASGATYESNFSGSSSYNSTLDSNDGLSKIRIYNGGSAQTNWRFKVYCPA